MTQPSEPAAEPSLSVYEAAFAALVLAALTAWLQRVATSILAPFQRWGLAPDPEGLGAHRQDWIDSVDSLLPSLLDMAKLGWDKAGIDLDSQIRFEPSNQIIQDQLARTRNLLVRISDEVYREIVSSLNKAVSEGLDVGGQADAVRRVLDATGSENWPARARTVAVTEVTRAWGFGGLAHAMTVSQRDPAARIWKMWDSKEDRHVRAAHNVADGQVKPVNEPFIVDREALMAPGDPSGSPHNVINCRCRPRFRRTR